MDIHGFQGMMRRIYLHHDSRRGKTKTYAWLREEIDELGEALTKNDKRALENEFADVLAWLASLANVADIDLEKAALAKYDDKCPRCRRTPCECPLSKRA